MSAEDYLHQQYLEAEKIRRMAESVARKLGKHTPPDFLNPEFQNIYKDGVIWIHDYDSWLTIRQRQNVGGRWLWFEVFKIGGLTANTSLSNGWLDHLKGVYTASQFLTPKRETGDQYIEAKTWTHNRSN